MTINRTERLTISHLGHHGDGLAASHDGPVIIPFSLPYEEVLVEVSQTKEQLHGKILEIISPSPSRISAPCTVFGQCGGCRLQHMDDTAYRAWKLGTVNHLLEKNGFSIQAEKIFVTPPASRRRVTFMAKQQSTGLQFGFHGRESHDVVTIETCPVLKYELSALIRPLREILSQLLQNGQSLSIHGTVLNGIVELVCCGVVFSEQKTEQLVQWAAQHHVARLFIKPDENAQAQVVLNQTALAAHYGAVDVALPPASFMQASDEAEAAMVAAIKPFFSHQNRLLIYFVARGCSHSAYTTNLKLFWR